MTTTKSAQPGGISSPRARTSASMTRIRPSMPGLWAVCRASAQASGAMSTATRASGAQGREKRAAPTSPFPAQRSTTCIPGRKVANRASNRPSALTRWWGSVHTAMPGAKSSQFSTTHPPFWGKVSTPLGTTLRPWGKVGPMALPAHFARQNASAAAGLFKWKWGLAAPLPNLSPASQGRVDWQTLGDSKGAQSLWQGLRGRAPKVLKLPTRWRLGLGLPHLRPHSAYKRSLRYSR